MGAVVPVGPTRARKLQVQLVDERRRGQRIGRPHRELTTRCTPQLVVDEWQYLVERLAPTGPEIREQLRDARRLTGECGRAIDRGLLIWHRWQWPNVDESETSAPDQLVASGLRARRFVDRVVAKD